MGLSLSKSPIFHLGSNFLGPCVWDERGVFLNTVAISSGILKCCFSGLNTGVCVMTEKLGEFTIPADATRHAGVLGTARERECDGMGYVWV